MEKIRVETNILGYPMPVVLVGTLVENRPNFMAVAWVSRVNSKPPLIGVALGKAKYTNRGIQEHQSFSVNVPGADQMEKVDYCGLVSGREADKSALFEFFYGKLPHAPMIRQCPLTMECRLFQTVDLPTSNLYIGEVTGTFMEERFLTDGQPDVEKMKPFLLTMPDNHYWRVGAKAGKAWSIGQRLKKEGSGT